LSRKPQIFAPTSFVLIGSFSPVYIHGRLLGQFSVSQAAFEQLLESHPGGYRKAGTSSLKRVTGRFSQVIFKAASRNFIWIFFSKRQLKIVNKPSAITRYCFDF
jgi:hypothetical protein